ncbi:MAG: Coq4 family protein [Pseudomonadota bacterium]
MGARTLNDHVPEKEFVWINGFAAPPAPRVRPISALVSVLRLIRNKEDTSLVFRAIADLAGKAGHNQFRKFVGTVYGAKVVKEPIKMENILSNREWLATMPEGSFGRAYYDFMVGQDLTPQGLLASARDAGFDLEADTQFPEYQRLFLHNSVIHDVIHVLTGYGRDALGEICNLAFTDQQHHSPGFKLIIAIGVLAQKREVWKSPIIASVRQAAEMGRQARFIAGTDLVPLMPLPLEDARAQLNLIEPTVYNGIPQSVKDNLLKPTPSPETGYGDDGLAPVRS